LPLEFLNDLSKIKKEKRYEDHSRFRIMEKERKQK